MEVIAKYFLYFIIYAFIGWLLEEVWHYIKLHKVVDRGFLIGPLCPIYGWGALFIVLVIGKNTSDVLSVFLKAVVVFSILEYFTSYIMEKLFHARWWDYTNAKFNINGRICLETMVPFGILGCFVIYIVHPFVVSLINYLSSPWLYIVFGVISLIFIVDNIISFNVMTNIRKHIKLEIKDNTEEMNKKVREWIKNHSILYRRINGAFPNFKILHFDKYKKKRS